MRMARRVKIKHEAKQTNASSSPSTPKTNSVVIEGVTQSGSGLNGKLGNCCWSLTTKMQRFWILSNRPPNWPFQNDDFTELFYLYNQTKNLLLCAAYLQARQYLSRKPLLPWSCFFYSPINSWNTTTKIWNLLSTIYYQYNTNDSRKCMIICTLCKYALLGRTYW